MPTYIHGHDESVLKSHKWRTVSNSIQFLVPYLDSKQSLKILDVGCGPGTITLDLAQNYTAPGTTVIGVDNVGSIIEEAKRDAEASNVTNLEYMVGDIFNLPFEDNQFDIVLSHQTLQHIPEAQNALKELARVVKPGGTLAVRDAIYESFCYGPSSSNESWFDLWKHTYKTIAVHNGGQPDAGAYYLQWAQEAKLESGSYKYGTSNWTYATPEELEWLGSSWSDRTLKSKFAELAEKLGFAQEDLNVIAEGWKDLSHRQNAVFVMVHGELLYTKPQ